MFDTKKSLRTDQHTPAWLSLIVEKVAAKSTLMMLPEIEKHVAQINTLHEREKL